MHFISILALRMPFMLTYDVTLTVLSAGIAIVVTGIALAVVGLQVFGASSLVLAGTIMGLGVGAMHYTGMAAIQGECSVSYTSMSVGHSLYHLNRGLFNSAPCCFPPQPGNSWYLSRLGCTRLCHRLHALLSHGRHTVSATRSDSKPSFIRLFEHGISSVGVSCRLHRMFALACPLFLARVSHSFLARLRGREAGAENTILGCAENCRVSQWIARDRSSRST